MDFKFIWSLITILNQWNFIYVTLPENKRLQTPPPKKKKIRTVCLFHPIKTVVTRYLYSLSFIDDSSTSSDDTTISSDHSPKPKRIRTTFTDQQLEVLHAHFKLDVNPDSSCLQNIAQITGLSKRVTQVWFQNSRARQKKYTNHRKICHVFSENDGKNHGNDYQAHIKMETWRCCKGSECYLL